MDKELGAGANCGMYRVFEMLMIAVFAPDEIYNISLFLKDIF